MNVKEINEVRMVWPNWGWFTPAELPSLAGAARDVGYPCKNQGPYVDEPRVPQRSDMPLISVLGRAYGRPDGQKS